MTVASPFTCVLDARANLGECPLWSSDEHALYWVDINAPTLNRFDPATGENRVMPMHASIGSFVFREAGGFVVALRDGIFLTDESGRVGECLAAAPYDTSHHRFNDGRCDPQGRFVVGAMNERRDAADAALYRIDGIGRLEELFGGLTISNGLAWSPDARTMYHADTPTRTIRAFDYPADGAPTNARVLVSLDGETERPDGGAVDRAGNYWTALYRAGEVRQFSPRGELLGRYDVPAMCPTMCAFGGDDLRTLYVTTARQQREPKELERLPQSGGIFAMRVDVPGLPEARFRG